ncbi:uncharacterized protein UHOD_11592 [Ustilago sp. UG-2017b]|nr:uncharacterized protein UHOD_11592 [Ustilago sp. UG-2017b]
MSKDGTTDHIEIGDIGGGMADPTEIGNRKDHMADSAEISNKDDCTTNSRRKKSCVKDTGKQIVRRRSRVEGIDTQLRKDQATDKRDVRGLAPETWVGLSRYSVTIKLQVARHDRYQCVGYDEGGGGGDKVGDVGVIPGPQWTTAFGSIYIRTAVILVICVTSDAAPALSPESTLFIEYCAGGPSSATPVLLSCVASFDTAPPPQDLLAGLLYTAPPPSTGDGSFDSYLSSP